MLYPLAVAITIILVVALLFFLFRATLAYWLGRLAHLLPSYTKEIISAYQEGQAEEEEEN